MKMKFRAKKSLGQNFLANPRILDKIVQAAEISKEDIVLEVGPGTGNLTKKLAEKAKRVIAIEKDRRLIEELKKLFKESENVEIIEGDILKILPATLNIQHSKYKIVANIPYYITSNFLRTIFEKWPKPKLIVLTIQKEVAQRIMAKPPKMNLLALSVQFYAEPKIIAYISKNNFRPRPKVDSAIIKLTPKGEINKERVEAALKLAKKAFAGKRKQLKNTLGLEILKKSDINLKTRPEELSLSDWLKIES